MSNNADKVYVSDLIYVENKETMINMENNRDTIVELLRIIRDLEARVTALE